MQQVLLKICSVLYGDIGVRSFQRIAAGIQNINFFPKNEDGVNLGFLSIMRFGQGEIKDPRHQRQIFAAQSDLAKAGVRMPSPIESVRGEILESVPHEIDGEKVPQEIAGKPMVFYTLLHGREVKEPTLADYSEMGRMHGKFLAEGQKLVVKYSDMQNPVSFAALQNMMKIAMGYDPERSIESILGDEAELKDTIAKVSETLSGRIAGEKKKDNPAESSIEVVSDFISSLQGGWYQDTLFKFGEASTIWQKKGFDKIPHEILHGDMHFGNVFLKDGEHEGGVFDMGWMGRGPAFLDFMQPLVLDCLDFDAEKERAYLQGLQEERPLTKFEIDNLPRFRSMTYYRSTPTRFMSLTGSENISDIKKSPVELTELQDKFEKDCRSDSNRALEWTRFVTQKSAPSVRQVG